MTTYPQLPAQDWNNLFSSTVAEYSSEYTDQALKRHPALMRLMDKNKKTGGMGTRIEERLKIGRNTGAKHLKSNEDSITLTDDAQLTVATYSPVFLAIPIKNNEVERSQNSGPEQIVDLAQLRMEQASDTAKDLLAEGLFGDGTDKTMVGLDAIVPATSGSNIYAGISEATAPFWRTQYQTAAGSWAANGYLGSATDKMVNLFLTCSDNGEGTPNLLITDQNIFEYYHRSLGAKINFATQRDFGEIGKTILSFLGAEMIWDRQCPANTVFMLHTENFRWRVDTNFNFRWTEPRWLDRQFLVSYQVMMLRYQLTCNKRNLMGRSAGWTA